MSNPFAAKDVASNSVPASYAQLPLQHLSDREHVRRRPAMYIGSTTTDGLFFMVDSVLTDCLGVGWGSSFSAPTPSDQLPTQIDVTLCQDHVIVIEDNGAWSPAAPDFQELMSLKTTGRWTRESVSYATGGLNIYSPLPVVNFLSSWCAVEVKQQGVTYQQTFAKGSQTTEIQTVDVKSVSADRGFKLVLQPDPTIFTECEWTPGLVDRLEKRLGDLSSLTEVTYTLTVAMDRSPRTSTFAPQGLSGALGMDFSAMSLAGSGSYHAECWRGPADAGYCEFAMCQLPNEEVSSGVDNQVQSFVNLQPTLGGTHVDGLLDGWRTWCGRQGCSTVPPVAARLSVWHPSPMFRGATRDYVSNLELEAAVRDVVLAAIDANKTA